MANIKSAKKRARQAIVRRSHNVSIRSSMRTTVKNVLKAVEAGDKEGATKAYASAVSSLDSSAAKGLIHANKAARQKSRLNKKVKALA